MEVKRNFQSVFFALMFCFAFFVVANLSAEGWLPWKSKKSFLYFGVQYGCLLCFLIYCFFKSSHIKTTIGTIVYSWKRTVVPPLAKWTVLFIAFVQAVHVCFGLAIYPFYNVGMFDWVEPNKKLPDICGQYRYYWKEQNGEIQVWRTRRQHIEWPPDLMGWGWNNEMTFPMTYHWPHLRKNYEYTLKVLQEAAGVQELFLGVETVNFSTGEVKFYEKPELAPPETYFAGWWKPLYHPKEATH
jgi:hypothetical protein